jgi:hypothetical protein
VTSEQSKILKRLKISPPPKVYKVDLKGWFHSNTPNSWHHTNLLILHMNSDFVILWLSNAGSVLGFYTTFRSSLSLIFEGTPVSCFIAKISANLLNFLITPQCFIW